MNGRVYDPYTARFLSADPFVSDPHNGQSYNRYSYVLNNPTNFTDPTGFLVQTEEQKKYSAELNKKIEATLAAGGIVAVQTGADSYAAYGSANAVGQVQAMLKADGTIKTNSKDGSQTSKGLSTLNPPGMGGMMLGSHGGLCDAGCGGGDTAPKDGEQFAWASQRGFYVHQRAGYLVFGSEISQDALQTVAQGHEWADAPFHQTAQYTYIHAMRNSEQTIEQARAASNEFVKNAATLALTAKSNGEMQKAYFWFGVALHTMQDSTSPSHRGFQLWTGKESGMDIARHVGKEMVLPSQNSDLFRVTRQAWSAFQSGNLSGFEVK